MKVIFNITENKNKATFQQEVVKINTSFNQTENIVKPKFQIGYYPLPTNIDLSNYYTKQEVIDNFKPISYKPDIDEVVTNGNTTSQSVIFQSSFGGSDWENTVTSVGNYFKRTSIGSSEVEEILFGHSGITSSDSNGNTAVSFAPKTKIAYITIPNESGTVVLDYQLDGYYKKTETFSQTEINNLLSTKQADLGFTPENVANKSDSFTASSSTTYASSKALVDGLATKQKKVTVITITGNTTLSEIHNGAVLNVTNTCTITIPTGLDANFQCVIFAKGSVIVTFVNGGVTIHAPSGLLLKTDKMAALVSTSANNFNLTGELATS